MAKYDRDSESPYCFFRPIFETSYLPSGRVEYEKRHKTAMDYLFYKPLVMTPEVITTCLPLRRLHESCNKACALYCVPNIPYPGPLASNSRTNIFHTVYDTWYVPDKCCIVYGAFATQFIGCWDNNSSKDTTSILNLHMELCKQVESRQGILDETDKLEPSILLDVKCHGNFAMTLSFRAAVIIIDKEDWRKEGVLLVRTSDEEGLKTWPIPPNQVYGEGIRLNLWDAVAAVLKMQRDIETAEERILRLVPEVGVQTR